MSYIVNKTSGQALVTILDGTTDTSTGMILIGRNYTNYGVLQNENFVRLMESFAGTAPPGQSVGQYALAGQLWYDTVNNTLQVYDGALWSPISGRIASAIAPTTTVSGFQWWDTANNQLKVWNGTSYSLVGPGYSSQWGLSGPNVEVITDSLGANHTVIKLYTGGNVIGVISYDAPFTPGVAISGMSGNIVPGFNLITSGVYSGTATNASSLNYVPATSYARTDIATGFHSDITVMGNIATNGASLSVNGSNAQLQNTNLNGSIAFLTNTNSSVIAPLVIDGSTGYVTVLRDPVNNYGVATKQYVDNSSANVVSIIATQATSLFANLQAFEIDVDANITILTNNLNATESNVANLQTFVTTLAPLASPALTGNPTTPTVSMWNSSTNIASTLYVDTQDEFIMNWANIQLASQGTSLLARLQSDENTFAPNASPQFSGIPTAPTPAGGDISTKIATTAFVANTMSYWSGPDANGHNVDSQRFISTSAPDNGLGNNGDFWFQISP